MSSKYFPGLPPYVDPGLEARSIPVDLREGLRSSWPVRQVVNQLAALAAIEAIPGDQSASLHDAFQHAVTLIDGQVVILAGQIEAATLLAAAYGLDDSRLREIDGVLKESVGDESHPGSASPAPSARDLYIAKAKELEAKLDEAARAMEAAETRATLAEKAASKARTDIGFLSNQVANLRSTIATREAEAARVKAGFEKALEEARSQLAEASKPREAAEVSATRPAADSPQADPSATPLAEVISEGPAVSPETIHADADENPDEPPADPNEPPADPDEPPADPSATTSKPAKPARKAR